MLMKMRFQLIRRKNVLKTLLIQKADVPSAKSILISCGARLAPFDIQEVRDITAYDELQLDTLGDKKTALFLIMSDTDATFNFLISMIYTQLFNLLCEKADDVYGGRLPVHVRCLIDEAANIGQIPNLEKLVATIRSREISACLVLQAQSQLKAIYKDNSDTIIGNMDSRIFLGGSEPTTLKELNQALGKETIDTYNTSNTRGNSPSYGMNYQKLGKDLATVDELAVLDDHIGEGGPKQKFARNMEAIKTLFQLESENRNATAEEQEILSNYVGWGGLADAFDPDKGNWAQEYTTLKNLLSEDEYAAARASTLNAHYTSPTVIRSIYDAVGQMGFETGNILEPAMGIGNFFGMLPPEMQSSRLYGVELDSITGRIAQKLYPNAEIKVAGFETTDRRDFYDLAVGNVPFGNYKVSDKPYDKLGLSFWSP